MSKVSNSTSPPIACYSGLSVLAALTYKLQQWPYLDSTPVDAMDTLTEPSAFLVTSRSLSMQQSALGQMCPWLHWITRTDHQLVHFSVQRLQGSFTLWCSQTTLQGRSCVNLCECQPNAWNNIREVHFWDSPPVEQYLFASLFWKSGIAVEYQLIQSQVEQLMLLHQLVLKETGYHQNCYFWIWNVSTWTKPPCTTWVALSMITATCLPIKILLLIVLPHLMPRFPNDMSCSPSTRSTKLLHLGWFTSTSLGVISTLLIFLANIGPMLLFGTNFAWPFIGKEILPSYLDEVFPVPSFWLHQIQ